MKTALLLFFFAAMNITPVFADQLYVWTDENGVTQSSTTKPADWKDQAWKHTKSAVTQKGQQATGTEDKNEAGSLRPRASFGSRHSDAVVGPGVSSGVTIEK